MASTEQKMFLVFFFFFGGGLWRVLVGTRGIFVEACGLFLEVRRLLSSCGVRVFFFSLSLVVARRLPDTWVL